MKNRQKTFGQFFTDPIIANFMAELALSNTTKTVLDPAVGKGIFIETCKNKQRGLRFTAFDIDQEMLDTARCQAEANDCFYHDDYLLHYDSAKYDAIICNPPYNKFQHIPLREKYIAKIKKMFGIEISGYSNLCVYFLIKSLNELSATGRCVYIVPYEFLNTGYGTNIKKYFLETKALKQIYKFNNSLNLFPDSLTTSCILVFDSEQNSYVDFIEIDSLSDVETKSFEKVITYSYASLNPEVKWSSYFYAHPSPDFQNLIDFSSIAKVKRGIATGSNAYFCLSRSDIEKNNLSNDVCLKCIAKSSDVGGLVFTEKSFNELYHANKKIFLFDGKNAKTSDDFAYIGFGESSKVNETYLNSHRTPWYALEEKAPSPIWISVFNRSRIKVIRNETDCKNLSTFHCVYLNNNDVSLVNILFCYLLTPICQKILYANKREYGGGLDKFEPNDLNRAKIVNLSLLTDSDKQKILDIYQEIKQGGKSEQQIDRLNSIFLSYLLPQGHNV